MNYQKFLDNVLIAINDQIPEDWIANIKPFSKNNGVIYDGLVINKPGLNISPTVYLNPYFHRYLDGVSLEDIYSDIMDTYNTFVPAESLDVDKLLNFDNCKTQFTLKLINYDKNIEFLRTVPHRQILDLAAIVQIYMGEDNSGFSAITITNDLLKHWDSDFDSIYNLAVNNTPRLFPYMLSNMSSMLDQLVDFGINMHILTNNSKINGATAILYPELLKDIADDFKCDLILVPSSIHEFLILPYSKEHDIPMLNNIIQEINEAEVADSDVLSDHAYIYDRKQELLLVG